MALDVYKEWLGIPEGDRPPDHYTLLRLIKFEDDEEKIRRNYTKLNAHVRKYATGQYSNESQELLNELAKAMLCLTDADRKQDYDESLGREIERKPGDSGRKSLLEYLVDDGVLSRDQAKEVESFADARGLSVRDAVVQMKHADAETATRAFAQELGYSFIDLGETIPDDSVLDKVPRNLVKRFQVLPLFVDDDVLLVACVHEPTPDLEEEMRLRYGVPMRPVMATPLAVNQAISKFYAPGARDEAVADEAPAADATKAQKAKTAKAKQAKAKAKAAKAGGKPSDGYSPEEKRQRKLLGIVILCWVTILCVFIDQMFFKSILFTIPPESILNSVPFPLTLIIPPATAFFVWKTYWQ